MAVGINESKPATSGISAQNSGLNKFFTAATLDTSQSKKQAILIVFFVYFMLWNVEMRFRDRNPIWHKIAETCRFLAGLLLYVMVGSAWDPLIFWIGLVIWAVALAVEAHDLYGRLRRWLRG